MIRMAIAENLKQHRKDRDWSQIELSEKSGVTQAQISQIESGARLNPGVITVKKLADALHITVAELIK